MDDEMMKRKTKSHCAYCEHAYISFCTMRCKKHPDRRILNAKLCDNYSPTLEPIEKRSLS